jgi:phospholipid/cholesterol/gamma-HCH transport system permease protein
LAETTQPLTAPRSPIAFLVALVDKVLAPPLDLLDEIGATVLLAAQAAVWLVRPPYRWAQLLIALDFIGAGSTFIVGLVGLFTGMAFTVSTIVGFRQFSAEGMVGGVVALAMARELAPVLAAVVVTARAGSTMASELGNMRVTEQIDAITTMGVSPIQYLVVPRIVATVLMLPLLAVAFGMAGMVGAYLVAVVWQNIDPGAFFDRIQSLVELADLRMLGPQGARLRAHRERHLLQEGLLRVGRRARGRGGDGEGGRASIVAIFAADYVLTTMLTEI